MPRERRRLVAFQPANVETARSSAGSTGWPRPAAASCRPAWEFRGKVRGMGVRAPTHRWRSTCLCGH